MYKSVVPSQITFTYLSFLQSLKQRWEKPRNLGRRSSSKMASIIHYSHQVKEPLSGCVSCLAFGFPLQRTCTLFYYRMRQITYCPFA